MLAAWQTQVLLLVNFLGFFPPNIFHSQPFQFLDVKAADNGGPAVPQIADAIFTSPSQNHYFLIGKICFVKNPHQRIWLLILEREGRGQKERNIGDCLPHTP